MNLRARGFQSPKEAGFAMPAEWSPHERCWMAWPARIELWGSRLGRTQTAYARVADAIAGFEPVSMLTPPADVDHARSLCGDAVSIVAAELDDSWTRDTGPNFVTRGGSELAASIFHFNAWGRKYRRFGRDAALGHRLADALGVPGFSSSLFLEGGAINVDGEGTLLTTESCVLNDNRNPGLSKAEAEAELCQALGVDRVIWLPGDPTDTETDGHIDGMACFIRPGVVMFETCPDRESDRYRISRENLAALERARDARGRSPEIMILNEAYEARSASDIFCRSYINFYICNGGVVMPGYGIERDREARDVVAAAFPDREVVQVDVNDIAVGGGGVHCITQQQPALAG